MQENKKVKFF